MEFFTQFGLLFSNMEWYVAVCIAVGMVLLIIEIFEPGFGIFGISGIVLLVLGVILRAVFRADGDNPLLQIFQMLLLYLLIAGLAIVFVVVAHKKNWLKKTPFVQEKTAVNPDFSDGTKNYGHLVGKVGTAVTDLRPTGKAEIDGTILDVVGNSFFIPHDHSIIITSVEGSKINVEEYKSNKE